MASDPSLDRPAAPDPPSSSSSKRRWSPCTWRYAIEESQPELGSKPRPASGLSSAPSATVRDRDRASEPPKKPPESPEGEFVQNGGGYDGVKAETEQLAETQKGQLQEEGREAEEKARRRKKKKKEGSRNGAGHGQGFSREMTPSELYFCEICAAKAASSSRKSSSPPLLVDQC